MSSFMRHRSRRARTARADATFVVQKDGELWSVGAARRQLFVCFKSKERAIAHVREIIRRIPNASFAIVDADA
jgi:hypothetical protein